MIRVEYVPNPEPHFTEMRFGMHDVGWHGVFGAYKVSFPDGWVVMMPHSGWRGTVSAEPLDVEDEEHREILIENARRLR